MKVIRVFLLSLAFLLGSAAAFSPARSVADLQLMVANYLGANVTVLGAVGQLVPGATSYSFRNSANSADNILIADAGTVTMRGDLVLSANSAALSMKTVNGISAAGSSITDCTAISRIITTVSTVSSGQGVCLFTPANNGTVQIVQNRGANDLKLYPPAAGGGINGTVAGTPITLAAATKDTSVCYHFGSGNFMCYKAPGPTS